MQSEENKDPTIGLTDEEREQIDAGDTRAGDDDAVAKEDAEAKAAEEKATADAAAAEAAKAKEVPVTASDLREVVGAVAKQADATARLAETISKSKEKAPEKKEEPTRDFRKEGRTLLDKYDKGEMTIEEFTAAQDKLDDEREAFQEKKTEALLNKVKQESVTEADTRAIVREAARTWDQSVAVFESDAGNKEFLGSPIRVDVFNKTLAELAKTPEFQGKPHLELLTAARDRIAEAFGWKPSATSKVADPAKKAAEKAAVEERAKKKPSATPDLSAAPSAGAAADTDGTFAALDAMDVNAREDALARMTPAARDKYLEDAPGGLRDNPRRAPRE